MAKQPRLHKAIEEDIKPIFSYDNALSSTGTAYNEAMTPRVVAGRDTRCLRGDDSSLSYGRLSPNRNSPIQTPTYVRRNPPSYGTYGIRPQPSSKGPSTNSRLGNNGETASVGVLPSHPSIPMGTFGNRISDKRQDLFLSLVPLPPSQPRWVPPAPVPHPELLSGPRKPTHLLSVECQMRKFNPEWIEVYLGRNRHICSVQLQHLFVANNHIFPSREEAKTAIAVKALGIVLQWPVPSRWTPTGDHLQTPQLPTSSHLHTLISDGNRESITMVLDLIEQQVGGLVPIQVKLDPVAARAFLAGFAMASQRVEAAEVGFHSSSAVPGC